MSLFRLRCAMLCSALIGGGLSFGSMAEVDCLGTTPIYAIQGKTHVSPYNGVMVETCGVVTAVAFNGYYIQDPLGDSDDETSDGMFVFASTSAPKPAVGTLLRLRDVVSEFIPGGVNTGNLSITQLSIPDVIDQAVGTPLPAPVIIGRSGRIPPNVKVISDNEIDPPINLQNSSDAATNEFNPSVDGIDFYESLEGMLVIVEAPVAVSATRTFSAFSSEFFVLANNGADVAPTNARNARGGIDLQPDPDNRGDQNPERIQIQLDGTLYPFSVPNIVVGDHVGNITGVIGYSFGNFEVNALQQLTITPANLQKETTALLGDKKHVTVATYNVLNLGPDSAYNAKRAAIASQIVTNLGQPDIIALQEILDNSGTIDDGTTAADQTLQLLVDEIIKAGGHSYEYIDVAPVDGTSGGIPGGNIRNAYLYNSDRVSLIGYESLTPAVLATYGVTNTTAFVDTRNPLKATFKFRGKEFTVINNHLTSRFGSTPIFGGPQPFVQGNESKREMQAAVLNEVVQAIIGSSKYTSMDDSKAPRVLVLGDLNTFEFTDDLTEILPGIGDDQILWNMVPTLTDDNIYSYNFEGNSQTLDHIFVSELLNGVAEYDIIHVNVDYPRVDANVASDHEPSIVRLMLKN